MGAMTRMAADLRRDEGLLADAVVHPTAGEEGELGRLAGDGERTAAHSDDYALLVETVFEGYLQHYAKGRVLRPADPGLALLAGDHLSALGLSRLAELGDLEAIVVLADVISDCARAHAEGRDADVDDIWRRGASAIAGAAAGTAAP